MGHTISQDEILEARKIPDASPFDFGGRDGIPR